MNSPLTHTKSTSVNSSDSGPSERQNTTLQKDLVIRVTIGSSGMCEATVIAEEQKLPENFSLANFRKLETQLAEMNENLSSTLEKNSKLGTSSIWNDWPK